MFTGGVKFYTSVVFKIKKYIYIYIYMYIDFARLIAQ